MADSYVVTVRALVPVTQTFRVDGAADAEAAERDVLNHLDAPIDWHCPRVVNRERGRDVQIVKVEQRLDGRQRGGGGS